MIVRKKPIEVEAVQFDGENGGDIARWSMGRIRSVPIAKETNVNPTGTVLEVHTLEGVMIARVGDWIIKGIKGEFYPCKGDIFQTTYIVQGARNEPPVKKAERSE